ncbi:Uncharacterised protein [Vibrio cholerae]|nr:Uncharacterised protein [Vibrio cholerae]CSI33948.1 Uncharacterised protein [Vibrio cholerae]
MILINHDKFPRRAEFAFFDILGRSSDHDVEINLVLIFKHLLPRLIARPA